MWAIVFAFGAPGWHVAPTWADELDVCSPGHEPRAGPLISCTSRPAAVVTAICDDGRWMLDGNTMCGWNSADRERLDDVPVGVPGGLPTDRYRVGADDDTSAPPVPPRGLEVR